jgi:restriction system protein
MESLGFTVEHVSLSRRGDRGIDLIAKKGADLDEVVWIVQCKNYSPKHKVGPNIVRELIGALSNCDQGTRGMIVTTSSFTSGAKEEAARANIRLVDGKELEVRKGKAAWFAF